MDGLGKAMAEAIIALAIVAFALGALVMWAVPKLWAWVKPWIHAATG